jgi:hypothetical protein
MDTTVARSDADGLLDSYSLCGITRSSTIFGREG